MTDAPYQAQPARRSWHANPWSCCSWGCLRPLQVKLLCSRSCPPLGRSVGLDEIRITAIISTSALVFTLVAPFWGRLSDRVGRKPVILIGLMGYCLGSLGFALLFFLAGQGLVTGLSLFVIALIVRSLQAATMSATHPGCTAYAADHTVAQFRIKTLSRLSSANSIGMIMGPVMAGLVADWACSRRWSWRRSSRDSQPLSSQQNWQKASRPVRLRLGPTHRVPRWAYSSLPALCHRRVHRFRSGAANLAFRLQDMLNLSGIETAQYTGWAMMASAISTLFMQIVIAQRFTGHPIQLVRWGAGLLVIGTLTISLLMSWVSVLISMALIGAGLGLLMPAVAAGASVAVGPEEQGGVSGLVSACPAAGFVLGLISGGFLYQYSPSAAAWGAAVILIAMLIVTLLHRPMGLAQPA